MEGITFASALVINMVYFHIKLDADAQKLFTIVFQWGKYKYKRLPMGIKITLILIFSRRHVKACPRCGICQDLF
jgi:hypothetical protein